MTHSIRNHANHGPGPFHVKKRATVFRQVIGGHRRHLSLTCSMCAKTDTFEIGGNSGSGADDANIAQRARTQAERIGWAVDLFRQKRCICPQCRVEAVADAILAMNAEQPTETPTEGQGDPMRTPTADVPKTPTVEEASATIVRQLDHSQKARVRLLLDSHFDDAKGAYELNWSDQRIGKEVDVPWSLVAQLRELAYGAIRSDPMADRLREDLNELGDVVHGLQTRIGDGLQDLAKYETELENIKRQIDLSLTRITEWEKTRGK